MLTFAAVGMAAGGACPDRPVATVVSAAEPADVCIPDGFNDVAIDYFDDYSWRVFVSLVWPAAEPKRGVPDSAKTVGDAGPRVFETFKSLGELFHDDGSAPTASFQDFDPASANACHMPQKYGDIVLASAQPWGDIGQAGPGDLLGPLVAQNGRYVRVQTLYNQLAYDFVVHNKYYLRSNLPGYRLVTPGSGHRVSVWLHRGQGRVARYDRLLRRTEAALLYAGRHCARPRHRRLFARHRRAGGAAYRR